MTEKQLSLSSLYLERKEKENYTEKSSLPQGINKKLPRGSFGRRRSFAKRVLSAY
jgi:hypothetical protein